MQNDSKLYTGGGDNGYTRTKANFRITKSDSVIELIGAFEEFLASLSNARHYITDKKLIGDIDAVIVRVKEIKSETGSAKSSVTKRCVEILENMIDDYQKRLGITDTDILPDKTKASAALCMSRAVIRRCERIAVKAGQFGRLKSELLAYINRLGDLMYCFAVCAETQSVNESNTFNSEAAIMNISPIPQNGCLTLSAAKLLAEEIEKQAISMGLRIVVAIDDIGANLMLLHSMDDAYIASSRIAQDKAYTTVALKMSTSDALRESRGGALDGLVSTSDNRIVLLGGGEPLKIGSRVVGGLGVSGGTAQQDSSLALFGAKLFEQLYS